MYLIALIALGWIIGEVYRDVSGKRRGAREKRIAAVASTLPAAMSKGRRRQVAVQHDAAWTAREVLTGFPVSRTAWHSAWLSHKTASIQQRHQRERAKQTHAEVHLGFAQELAAHRARLAKIKGEIDQVVAELPDPPRTAKAVQGAAEAVVLPFRRKDEPAPDPVAPTPGPYAAPAEVPACSACGHPGRPGDELVPTPEGWNVHQSHFDDPSTGFHKAPDATPRSDEKDSPDGCEWPAASPTDARPIPQPHHGKEQS